MQQLCLRHHLLELIRVHSIVLADYEYNFLDNTRVQTGIGMNYRAQCWSFEGAITDSTGVDNSHNFDFEIKVNLFGLGEFGI